MYRSYTKSQRWSFIGLANAGVLNGILLGGNVVRKEWGLVTINGLTAFASIMALTYFLLKED